MRAPWLWAVLMISRAALLGAQTSDLLVTVVRPLDFGTVLPAITRVVQRTDPGACAQFTLTGTPNGQVQLNFTLTTGITGPGGQTLQLVFGANDAGYSQAQSINSQVGFDPAQPFVVTLSPTGRGTVFIGGAALPESTQPAATYNGTVTLAAACVGL